MVGRALLAICLAAACSRSSGNDPKANQDPKAKVTEPQAAKLPADDRYNSGSLGALTFQLSEGSPAARAHFTRGLLALHSFWYDEAIREFDAAIKADAQMNMAYWGAAMSRCQLLWGKDDVSAARQLIERMPDPRRLPNREQAWISAAIALLSANDVPTSRKQFLRVMEGIHHEFPDDESATFYALALLSASRREDHDNMAVRLRAADLAKQVFDKNPKHPGAAHYAIHAYDTPELAAKGLSFAQAYAKIAPEAFHARHMPSHIFSRLGMWKEAIQSCHDAWDASLAAAKRQRLSPNHHDFHSLNWLVEMYFELGRAKDAAAQLDHFGKAVRAGLNHEHRALYANQVASYAMRSGQWSRVDELLAALEAPPVEDGAAASAGTQRVGDTPKHCGGAATPSPPMLMEQMAVLDTRVRAAAVRRDVAATKRLLAELDGIRKQLDSFLTATQPKEVIAKIDEQFARRRAAMTARAAGNDRALIEVLRTSVPDADVEAGGENNPSGFMVHEELGDALMRLGRAKDAAAEYALNLKKQPARARSILGAARAAAKAGDAATARTLYAQLLQQWSGADADIDGLAEARAATAASP